MDCHAHARCRAGSFPAGVEYVEMQFPDAQGKGCGLGSACLVTGKGPCWFTPVDSSCVFGDKGQAALKS